MGQGNGGSGAVVNHLAASLAGPFFQKVDAQTGTAPYDMLGANPVLAQGIDSTLAQIVGGQLGDKGCLLTIVDQGYSYVGLAPGVACLKDSACGKTQISGGFNRIMISPKVTILLILPLSAFRYYGFCNDLAPFCCLDSILPNNAYS